MIPTPHLDAALNAWRGIVAPPPAPRDIDAFLATLRYPDGPQGPRAESPHGDLISMTPLQRHMLGVLADAERWQRVSWCKPVQAGVTFVVGAWLAWQLKERRRGVLYALPTKELHEIVWRGKFRPLWLQVDGMLPASGPGSDDGVPALLRTGDGVPFVMLSTGGRNEAGQSAATIGIIIQDELDSMKPRMRKLLDRRRRMYGSEGRTISFSTIKHDRGSPIDQLHQTGTADRPHYACAACGHWQTWEWAQVQADWSTPLTARETIRVHCEACNHAHDNDAWQSTLLAPRFVPHDGTIADDGTVTWPEARTNHYSIRHTCLDDVLFDLRDTAIEYQEAHENLERFGDPEPMRQFHRDYLTQGYTDAEETLALRERTLAQRSALAVCKRGEAPAYDAAPCCVAAIDVQKRGLWYQVQAGNPATQRRWIIDEGWHPICGEGVEPTDAQRYAGLDHVRDLLMQGYPRPTGYLALPQIGFVDTADGNTADGVWAWLHDQVGWYGIRGNDDERLRGADAIGTAIYRLPGILSVYEQPKADPPRLQLELMVHQLKSRVVRGLARGMDDEGAILLPKGCSADSPLIRQLCAEELRMTDKGPAWVQTYRHNHQLDLAGYCYAALEWLAASQASASDQPAEADPVVGKALG